jgi:hypothetical protein
MGPPRDRDDDDCDHDDSDRQNLDAQGGPLDQVPDNFHHLTACPCLQQICSPSHAAASGKKTFLAAVKIITITARASTT